MKFPPILPLATVLRQYGLFSSLLLASLLSAPRSHAQCEARFVMKQLNDSMVEFWDSSLAPNPHYRFWGLGNGDTAKREHFIYTYDTFGVYRTSLHILDTLTGCESSIGCQYAVIQTTESCVPFFTYHGDGLNITFNNISRTKTGFTSQWYMGDGQNYDTSLQSFNHQFAKPGKYKVCLNVTDTVTGCGPQGTRCRYVTVPIVCKAQFVINQLNDSTVEILNSSTMQHDYWSLFNMGDGYKYEYNPGIKNFKYIYRKDGNYQVCLTVTDKETCCKSSTCQSVVIKRTSGTHDEFPLSKLKIYPNPVQDRLFIEPGADGNESLNVAVFDLYGRQISKHSLRPDVNGRIDLNTESLAPGMYVLQVLDHRMPVMNARFYKME